MNTAKQYIEAGNGVLNSYPPKIRHLFDCDHERIRKFTYPVKFKISVVDSTAITSTGSLIKAIGKDVKDLPYPFIEAGAAKSADLNILFPTLDDWRAAVHKMVKNTIVNRALTK